MSENYYPLFLEPIYKDYIWGGDRIKHLFKRPFCPPVCAESWELSDRHDGMSSVANGLLAGSTLNQLVERMQGNLLGSDRTDLTFPLLLKIIDARQRLSVQVHPDEQSAKSLGGEAKTEMWYILDAKPGTKVFAGFKKQTDTKTFEQHLKTNRVEELLNSVEVKTGDSIYIPGGTIHSIGEGCLILEVQQNSNTTYRVYDWNRVDKTGKPRELHIKEALKAINWDEDKFFVSKGCEHSQPAGNSIRKLVTSPYFTVETIVMDKKLHIKNDGKTFHVLFTASGSVSIEGNSSVQQIPHGATCLVPAAISDYVLTPTGKKAVVIRISR